jgi:hypothetical protein
MKPDIAAPGVAIISAISSFTDSPYTSVANVTFNLQGTILGSTV